MTSTYTTDNGIEKPATGDRSGTWGTMVNSNMDLVDQALDGFVSVTAAATGSTGSPNTLPITNGSVSNGRNRIIHIVDGGDLGGTVYYQVTPNDAEKWFWIKNGLTASRAILLFQGTYNASNDLEIPNGKTCLVRCDGGGSGAVVSYVTADSQVTGSLAVDNLLLDGNTISSTDSNGAVAITPNGTGTIGIGSASTGAVTITPATTITGVATLTAQPILSSLTASKPVFTDGSKGLVSTGTLAVVNGGSGQTTYTNGQILIGNSTGNTLAKATITAGSGVSVTNGSGSITIAATGTGGTVTSVGVSGGTTGLTTSGGPVTGSGTITVAGTLAVANGGAGQTSYTDGQLLVGKSTGNTLAKATITAGAGVSVTNGSGTITIAATGSADTEWEKALAGKLTGTLSSGTTAMTANRRYRISAAATGTLPTFSAGQGLIIEFTVGDTVVGTVGRNSQTIDGAAADDTYTGDGSTGPIILYSYVSSGVVTSTLIGATP